MFWQWLGGRFVLDYDPEQVAVAFAALVDAYPDGAGISDPEVHVWAAASPRLYVTPRAYLEDDSTPYLAVSFPDVRICIGDRAGRKSSVLEIQFSVEGLAHIAFGGKDPEGTRTLFTLRACTRCPRCGDRPHAISVSPPPVTPNVAVPAPAAPADRATDGVSVPSNSLRFPRPRIER